MYLCREWDRDVLQLHGGSISLEVSTAQSKVENRILNAFTADQLTLTEQSCPTELLKKRYCHLHGLALKAFSQLKPMILIGSKHPHLITSVGPVLHSLPWEPVAGHTELGWVLQGSASILPQQADESVWVFLPSSLGL